MVAEKGDDRENYDEFQATWRSYMNATGVNLYESNDPRKFNLMWTAIGEDAKKKYLDFELTDADKGDYDSALKKIREVIYSNADVTKDRFNFGTCKQLQHESFSEYNIRLKKLVKRCNYGALEDELLCQQLIVGVKEMRIRRKLLETRNLTSDKAVQIGNLVEITDTQMIELSKSNPSSCGFKSEVKEEPVSKISKIPSSKTSSTKKQKCKFCARKAYVGRLDNFVTTVMEKTILLLRASLSPRSRVKLRPPN